MILVDTSVWIDHLRSGDRDLARALESGTILAHPFVIGELALGHLREREQVIETLLELPMAPTATDVEVRRLIETARLFGRGIGYVDAHLLAATRLAHDAKLWTRDRTLREVARQMEVAFESS